MLLATGGDITKRTYLRESFEAIINYGNGKGIEWICAGRTKEGYPRHPSRGEYRALTSFDPGLLLK